MFLGKFWIRGLRAWLLIRTFNLISFFFLFFCRASTMKGAGGIILLVILYPYFYLLFYLDLFSVLTSYVIHSPLWNPSFTLYRCTLISTLLISFGCLLKRKEVCHFYILFYATESCQATTFIIIIYRFNKKSVIKYECS